MLIIHVHKCACYKETAKIKKSSILEKLVAIVLSWGSPLVVTQSTMTMGIQPHLPAKLPRNRSHDQLQVHSTSRNIELVATSTSTSTSAGSYGVIFFQTRLKSRNVGHVTISLNSSGSLCRWGVSRVGMRSGQSPKTWVKPLVHLRRSRHSPNSTVESMKENYSLKVCQTDVMDD